MKSRFKCRFFGGCFAFEMQVAVKILVVAFARTPFDIFEALFCLLLYEGVLCFDAMSLVEGLKEVGGSRENDGIRINVSARFLRCDSVNDGVVDFNLNDI